jgi:hypothetical protein
VATEPVTLISVGVAAVCGVANTEFNNKHWGAAAIAAGLLAGEQSPSTAARSAITKQAERLMTSKAAWFPPPVQSGPGDIGDVVAALTKTAATLNLLGHDTIFAALTLRAMSDHPELATSANIDALVTMVEFARTQGPGGPFSGWEDPGGVLVEEEDEIPAIGAVDELAVSAVTAFAAAGTIYDGFDRGVVQHVLTHAHALIELQALGHSEVVSSGIEAHRIYRKLLTRRPSDGERPLPTPSAAPDFHSEHYWQQDLRGSDDWLFGHVFKVAYAWRSLESHLPAAELQKARPMLATSMVLT